MKSLFSLLFLRKPPRLIALSHGEAEKLARAFSRMGDEINKAPARVPLTPRYAADPAVALHAQSVALRMLASAKTQRIQVQAGMPGAEAFRYDNDASFPGITLHLYRIPGVPHSWKVVFPPGNGKPREVILSGAIAIPLDGAEFEQAEKMKGGSI